MLCKNDALTVYYQWLHSLVQFDKDSPPSLECGVTRMFSLSLTCCDIWGGRRVCVRRIINLTANKARLRQCSGSTPSGSLLNTSIPRCWWMLTPHRLSPLSYDHLQLSALLCVLYNLTCEKFVNYFEWRTNSINEIPLFFIYSLKTLMRQTYMRYIICDNLSTWLRTSVDRDLKVWIWCWININLYQNASLFFTQNLSVYQNMYTYWQQRPLSFTQKTYWAWTVWLCLNIEDILNVNLKETLKIQVGLPIILRQEKSEFKV